MPILNVSEIGVTSKKWWLRPVLRLKILLPALRALKGTGARDSTFEYKKRSKIEIYFLSVMLHSLMSMSYSLNRDGISTWILSRLQEN